MHPVRRKAKNNTKREKDYQDCCFGGTAIRDISKDRRSYLATGNRTTETAQHTTAITVGRSDPQPNSVCSYEDNQIQMHTHSNLTASETGPTAQRHRDAKALLAHPGSHRYLTLRHPVRGKGKIYQTLPGWHSPLSPASSSERLLSTSHGRPPPPPRHEAAFEGGGNHFRFSPAPLLAAVTGELVRRSRVPLRRTHQLP